MVNDAFESVLQQTALVYPRSFKRKLEVALGEFRQLRHIRSNWGAVVEKPDNADFVTPSGCALFQCLQQSYRCGRILWPNTPKRYVDVTQKPLHCLRRMISTDIHQKPPMCGPVFKNLLAHVAAICIEQPKGNIFVRFRTLVVAGNTGSFVQIS